MPHTSEQKQELRQAILERIQHMNEQSKAAESRSIVRRILEVLPADGTICAFVPMKTEPDIRPLLEQLLQSGRLLFLPSFDGRHLVMRKIETLSDLIQSTFGIPEPPPACPPLDPKKPAVVLIPGRAFDRTGKRLGRGNGGYDRWITAHRKENGQSLYYGVAFECQIVSEVPVEEHDAHVDRVITARELMKAS